MARPRHEVDDTAKAGSAAYPAAPVASETELPQPKENVAIQNAEQMHPADKDAPLAGELPSDASDEEKEKAKPKAASGETLAKVVFDGIGWQPTATQQMFRSDGTMIRERTMFADKDEIVSLPESEFERLEALGAVEKA